jgi:hypothetical protein
MTLELIEDAAGDPRNAQALAVASELAYLPAAEGAEAFRTQLGLEARLLSAGHTQAYVAHNDKNVVVAFRGTEAPTSIEGLKDWLLADAVNLLILPEGRLGTDFAAAGVGAKFHQGFLGALAQIWDPLFEAVEAEQKKQERPLWLTGHSLGGALALLAGWLFQRKFVPVHQIYTFGAPMVGNAEASKAFDREFPDKIFRYVNITDPIPKLPTVSLLANDYGHCLKEVGLGTVAAGATSAGEFFQQMVSRTVNGVLNATLIDDIWDNLKQRVNAHFLPSYQSLIAELFKERG